MEAVVNYLSPSSSWPGLGVNDSKAMATTPFYKEMNMATAKEKKAEIISKFQAKDGDTGSCEVQVALLTERINSLTTHLQLHRKDHHTRRGLMHLISQRNRLLKYVYGKDHNRYRDLVGRLGIRAKYDRLHKDHASESED
jgi:small subunit ribosomal protein S15